MTIDQLQQAVIDAENLEFIGSLKDSLMEQWENEGKEISPVMVTSYFVRYKREQINIAKRALHDEEMRLLDSEIVTRFHAIKDCNYVAHLHGIEAGNKLKYIREFVETKPKEECFELIEALEHKGDELQLERDGQQYKEDRTSAYPAINEQLDLMFHSIKNHGDMSLWLNEIENIKTQFPKPE